jgi:hypothetical protein
MLYANSGSLHRRPLCTNITFATLRPSRSCNMGIGVQHLPIEAVGEHHSVVECLKLKTEATLPAREKCDLEQRRLYLLVIRPSPHLGHGSAQVGVTPPNLDKVHRSTPGKCFWLRRYIGWRPTLAMGSFAATTQNAYSELSRAFQPAAAIAIPMRT